MDRGLLPQGCGDRVRAGQLDYTEIARRIEARGGLTLTLEDRGIAYGTDEFKRIERSHYNGVARGHSNEFFIDEVCVKLLRCTPHEVYGMEWTDSARFKPGDAEWVEQWANGGYDEEVAA